MVILTATPQKLPTQFIMLPNEVFALECRKRYEEQGLIVDKRNGQFAHCPLPRGMGDEGVYLLWGDHQHQGLLQSRDVGRRCFYTYEVKRWLDTFPEGFFELYEIYDEFNSGEHNPMYGRTGENHPRFGIPHTEEWKKAHSERMSGENNPMFGVPGKTGENNPCYGRTQWKNELTQEQRMSYDKPEGEGWERGVLLKSIEKGLATVRSKRPPKPPKLKLGYHSKKILAIKPGGEEVIFGGRNQAARELNIDRHTMLDYLNKGEVLSEFTKYPGWQFRYA